MHVKELHISDVKSLLELPKRIVIITHRNPDGDAIGSALALQHYLRLRQHAVQVIFPSDYPPVFGFLKGIKEVLVSVVQKEESISAIEKAEVIFLVDFNALDRIDDMGEVVMHAEGVKLMIDHHLDPEPIADWVMSDPTASSTAELIYLFLEELGHEKYITREIATALFTGILTDTGSFKFSTSSRVFRVASRLKELGVDDYWLQNRLYNSLTEKQLRLIGHCIANRMELLPKLRTGIFYLTAEDYQNFKIQRGDTEGIVNYILMMRSMRIAAFITEQNNTIKLSFRSKGNVSVQELARIYFNGGGHKNASGGSSKLGLQETIDHLKQILPEYLAAQGHLIPS